LHYICRAVGAVRGGWTTAGLSPVSSMCCAPGRAGVLKHGEAGTPVAEVCRKAGISQATYFNWRKKYAGLLPDEMRRLKALEDENGRLKKIVADLTLDREMLQDVIRRKL
jgi:putative transposase